MANHNTTHSPRNLTSTIMAHSIRSILQFIGIGWLLHFWSLPYLTAFATLPTQQRSPLLFPGEIRAPCGLVGVHLLGDTAKDIAFKTDIETSKQRIERTKVEAETEIAKFQKDLDSTETRSTYLTYVTIKLRNHMEGQSEQAVSDAQSIKRKAISHVESLASDSIAAFVKAGNWTDRSFPATTILLEMERIKAEGLKQIEDISAKLNKDAKAAAEAFEILIEAIK